jgi:putative ABC transport system permease protein
VNQPIGGIATVTGIDFDEFSHLSGSLKFLAGGPFRKNDDVIIDQWYAEQNKKAVGDKVNFLNRDWQVCGIIEPGKLARLMVSRAHLQDITNNKDKVHQVLLRLDNPANTRLVIDHLKKVEELDGCSIYSVEELISQFSFTNVPGLRAFIYVIIGLSITIGFLVVGLTMYTTVLERTREIGILKALGASPANILGILIRETALLAVAGWLAGILLSFAANWAINHFVHANLQSEITPDWWPIVFAIAMIACLLGAIYPGLRAARQDAIEALAYE